MSSSPDRVDTEYARKLAEQAVTHAEQFAGEMREMVAEKREEERFLGEKEARLRVGAFLQKIADDPRFASVMPLHLKVSVRGKRGLEDLGVVPMTVSSPLDVDALHMIAAQVVDVATEDGLELCTGKQIYVVSIVEHVGRVVFWLTFPNRFVEDDAEDGIAEEAAVVRRFMASLLALSDEELRLFVEKVRS